MCHKVLPYPLPFSRLILIGSELVEVLIIDRFAIVLPNAVPQQIIMIVLGLVCFGLAAYLWMADYRKQHAYAD